MGTIGQAGGPSAAANLLPHIFSPPGKPPPALVVVPSAGILSPRRLFDLWNRRLCAVFATPV